MVFNIVANEVRNLADQSQEASANIDNIIIPVLEDLHKVRDVIDKSNILFQQKKDFVDSLEKTDQNIESFLHGFINQQVDFCKEFEELNELKTKINQDVTSITSAVQESVATTEELASLTMTPINATVSLVDMADALEKNLSINTQGKDSPGNGSLMVRKKRIAILFCSEVPFFNSTMASARSAASKYNVEVEFYAPKTQDKYLQLEQIREVIDKKFDAMAIDPSDEDPEITDAINEAVKRGIKVICFDADASRSQRLGIFDTNGLAAGQAAARAAAKVLNNQGTVIVNVWSNIKKSNIIDRAKGFINEINNIPGMKVIQVATTSDPSDGEAEEQIKEVFDRYPEFDLAFTTNAEWGVWMTRYFKKYGIQKKLITFDCSKELGEYINEGIIQIAISQRQFIWGELAVKWLVDAMAGKEIPQYEDTGTYEVNKSNYQIFKERFL
jgi:ABC-type sugar transport system substrate-binding protein